MAPTKVNICKYGIGWTKMLQLLLVHQRALREIRWWLKKTFLKANTSEKKKWGKSSGYTKINGKAHRVINGVSISCRKPK